MNDTPPSIEALQLELQKKRSPDERMRLAFAFSAYLINLSRNELEKRFSKIEARIEWVRLNYGEDLAKRYRLALRERGDDV
jgi:hypothetical protein